MTLRPLLTIAALSLAAPGVAQAEEPPRPPPMLMAPDFDPLAHLSARVGPTWVAKKIETTPDGRRYRDTKSYRSVLKGTAVAVVNARFFENGQRAVYLEGLYYVEPKGRQLRHVAVFAGGATVDSAELATNIRRTRHSLRFTLTLPDGEQEQWRSSEYIDDARQLVEQAARWNGEAWEDMGTTVYRAQHIPLKAEHLFP